MLAGLENGLRYAGIVTQIPSLHDLLMGNIRVAKFIAAQPFLNVLNPLRTMV